MLGPKKGQKNLSDSEGLPDVDDFSSFGFAFFVCSSLVIDIQDMLAFPQVMLIVEIIDDFDC